MYSFLAVFILVGFFFSLSYGIKKARLIRAQESTSKLHSLPLYHGLSLALFTILPALFIFVAVLFFHSFFVDLIVQYKAQNIISAYPASEAQAILRDGRALALGDLVVNVIPEHRSIVDLYQTTSQNIKYSVAALLFILMVAGFMYGLRKITAMERARDRFEKCVMALLIACSAIAILTTLGIVFSLIFESLRFFQKVPFFDFVFGMHWSPQSAFVGTAGTDSDTNSKVFGIIPLLAGTFLITLIAMLVAAPIGLLAAIYLADYASKRFRAIAKPLLEILAGIPTVVYGFFAALTVAPFIRQNGEFLGLSVSSESALAAGLVMGIMIIPFVSSLSDDVLNAVPQALRDGSAGLGATRSETIRKVVLPAALPGVVSALILATSRAIGETMIVVMAAGLAANLTINPLEAVTTVTVQIVTLLVGDQEFDSAKTLAAFALGLILFCITLILNIIALRIVQHYREQYD